MMKNLVMLLAAVGFSAALFATENSTENKSSDDVSRNPITGSTTVTKKRVHKHKSKNGTTENVVTEKTTTSEDGKKVTKQTTTEKSSEPN